MKLKPMSLIRRDRKILQKTISYVKRSTKAFFSTQKVNLDDFDICLISFPKCGRTWLRVMIGNVLQEHFNLAENNLLESSKLQSLPDEIPKILVTHSDEPFWKKPEELIESKAEYQSKKAMLLVRNPKDVVVSSYFEKKKRIGFYDLEGYKSNQHMKNIIERVKPYDGDVSNYVYEPVGSLQTIINFYNIWAKNRHVPQSFLLVRYEDLVENTVEELKKVLEFIGLYSVSDETIAKTVGLASLENMKAMEKTNRFETSRLQPADPSDPESYKVRKGKVGGFVDYLDPKEIKYCDEAIANHLSPIYRYES